MPSSGVWRRVDLVWTDVSEKHIASIFRVEKSASEEPAWAGGCRLSHQSKTPRYIRIGREGQEAAWKSIERRGVGSVEMGERVAESGIVSEGYRASIDPVASWLSYRACIDLRSLVDLASCSGGFMREQMRGFHDLLRQKPTSLFIFVTWKWRRCVPTKCRFTHDLHGATSKKTAFFKLIEFYLSTCFRL
jgi:hypothetical protein